MVDSYHYHAAVRFVAIYENHALDENVSVDRYEEFKSYLEKLTDEDLSLNVDKFLNGAGLTFEERTAIELIDGLRDGNWEKASTILGSLISRELPQVLNHSANSIHARGKLNAYAVSLRNNQTSNTTSIS